MLQYDGVHNYFEQKINDSLSLIKYKIKKEIKKSSIPFNIKQKRVFNQISQDIGFICPEFKSIKSQIIRDIIKNFLPTYQVLRKFQKNIIYILQNKMKIL